MRCFPTNLCIFTVASMTLLLTGCSFATGPGTILGEHVELDAKKGTTSGAHRSSTSRTSHSVHSFGGWTPTYYHDRLMFFDDMGQPFFYSGKTRVYVSNSSPQYSVARDNWRRNQYAYDRWHAVYHKPRFQRSRR